MPPKRPDVAAFLAALDHPLKPEIEAVRQIILGVSPTIQETIKWNAPSFRTHEDFATFHLRRQDVVQIVMHRGTKVRALPPGGLSIPDPAGLLTWITPDRGMLTLGADIQTHQGALVGIIEAWIRQL